MKSFATILLFVLTGTLHAFQSASFEDQIDMTPWSDRVAVFTEGRVKSFETFSRSYMPFIMGSRSIDGQTASFTFFDMLIMPQKYVDKDIIYIKNKGLRAAIIAEATPTHPAQDQMNKFMERGLISREVLQQPAVLSLLGRLRQDVMRFATPIEKIEGAIGASDPRSLWASLRIVPPKSGSWSEPWTTLDTITDQQIVGTWSNMVEAWQNGDANTVNTELAKLSVMLPQLAAGTELYPTPCARDWKGANKMQTIVDKAKKGLRSHLGQLPNRVALEESLNILSQENRSKDLHNMPKPNGQLNPNWTEWLMGYPIGYTDLKE